MKIQALAGGPICSGILSVVYSNISFCFPCRTVEGIFRSFNNLQEHFHQSFFMYLLPASERYISIALYMPVLGGILIGPLLHAVSLWMQTLGKDMEKDMTSRESVSMVITLTNYIDLSDFI